MIENCTATNLQNVIYQMKRRTTNIMAYNILIMNMVMAFALVTASLLFAQVSGDVNKTSTVTNSTTNNTTITTITVPTPISSAVDGNHVNAPLINNSTNQGDIDAIRKKIHDYVDSSHGENRLSLNKPTSNMVMEDYSPESIEARVALSTSQFGLRFLNAIDKGTGNVVISPLSLQNLLNMILLGTKDGSNTYQELVKILGYDDSHLLSATNQSDFSNRLKPHEGMRSLIGSMMAATHMSPMTFQTDSLLNTNTDSIKIPQSTPNIDAHLQTTSKDGHIPLDEQLNFTLANLILTNRDLISLKDDYQKELKAFYDVRVEQFSKDSKNVTIKEIPLHIRINNWVKNMTQGQIDKLASENDLNTQELLVVLLNAAHFKGRWLHTFNSHATHEGTFYNNGLDKEAKRVLMMRQKNTFGYLDLRQDIYRVPYLDDSMLSSDHGSANDQSNSPTIEMSKEDALRVELSSKLNCSVLMLPFSLNDGQELSMMILLPAKRDGVDQLQASLSAHSLNEIYKLITEQQVQVELPKFTFETSYDAKDILSQIGLVDIFRGSPNLDRMFTLNTSSKLPVKVDKIIHKAKITVDETGAEAAAASMALIALRNYVRQTPIFTADHPFIFIIRHIRSNMPLFMGRVNAL